MYSICVVVQEVTTCTNYSTGYCSVDSYGYLNNHLHQLLFVRMWDFGSCRSPCLLTYSRSLFLCPWILFVFFSYSFGPLKIMTCNAFLQNRRQFLALIYTMFALSLVLVRIFPIVTFIVVFGNFLFHFI